MNLKIFVHFSLLEVLYKLIVKIYSNQKNVHLEALVPKTQFGFVPGRTLSSTAITTLHLIDKLKTIPNVEKFPPSYIYTGGLDRVTLFPP